MAGRGAWLAALTLFAWHGAYSYRYTVLWPGCPRASWDNKRIVQPGQNDDDVTYLSLPNCNIHAITSNDLKGYPDLQYIVLTDNRISVIEAPFHCVPSLQNLILDNNVFLGRNLPPNLFQNCSRLRRLDLNGNDMSDAPADLMQGLVGLEGLALNNCSLRSMPSFLTHPALPKMTRLTLNHNHITKLDDPETFVNMAKLDVLYMTHNQINYVHKDLFKPLAKIEDIDFSFNKLRSVPEELFQNKSRLNEIVLSHNLIEYVSVETFLGTNLKKLSLENNRLTYLPVDFCAGLKSIGVSLQDFYFNGNPWQCGCLNELLIDVKKLGIYYSFGYDAGKRPQCFITDGFKCHRTDAFDLLSKFYSRIS